MYTKMLTAAFIVVGLFISLTIVIAWLNWNEKIFTLVMTGLIVGTATAFTAIVFTLKDERTDESFTTCVIVDERKNLPFGVYAADPITQPFHWLMSEYRMFANPVQNVNGKDSVLFDTPKNQDEVLLFNQELLQFSLTKTIADVQQVKRGHLLIQLTSLQ